MASPDERMARWVAFLDQHTPSLTDQDEALIYERVTRWDEDVTAADYALRTCRCGERIDGFYDYIDHLKAVTAAFGGPTDP